MSQLRNKHSWATRKKGGNFLTQKLQSGTELLKKQLKNGSLWKNLGLFLVAAILFGSIIFLGAFAWFSRDLPDPNSLTIREVPQSTKIYDRTGEHLLYEISGDQKRTLVTLDQIPMYMQKATITAEDRKFYDHKGVDIKGILRAVVSNVTSFNLRGQGGSTITQQLVKNAILTSEKTYTRKIKELILSLALERRYEKDDILQLYLNEIAYGSTNYGIESASRAYFDKSVEDLTIAEAATLAALPQAPSAYLNNPERLLERRDWVLRSMEELGYITSEDLEIALSEETPVKPSVAGIEAPHFSLWIKEQLEQELDERTVEQGGLRVITTLDLEKQHIAEEAVKNNVEARSATYGFNNSGLVSIDPRNGHILAMVGSADYFNDEIAGQVNVTMRPLQPGSSFKPMIYAAGFEKGYTPDTILWDVETDFPTATGNYRPRNFNLNQYGDVTIRKALQGSLNIPAVKMLYLIGVDGGIDFAERLRYTTFEDRDRFGLAIVLGGAEVKLLEHTAAYATFANEGVYHEPTAILSVETSDGKTLYEWKESEGERIVDANVARMLSDVLSDNAARNYVFGSNSVLTLGGRPVAAKTGTTNNYRDAWTMGYTPSLVTGVWSGNTNGANMNNGAGGSSVAGPVWNEYMRKALDGTPHEQFVKAEIPKTGKTMLDGKIPTETFVIDTASGKLATDRTPARFRENKTCGEFHSILWYVDKANPTGAAPKNPERDPHFNAWESAVQAYIGSRSESSDEDEVVAENCTKPEESDDLHVAENEPSLTIRSPKRNDTVPRTFTVLLSSSAPRGISRIEYAINDTYITETTNGNGSTINLPSWVKAGTHTLTVTAYDDIDNSKSESVQIRVDESEDNDSALNDIKITNPVHGQRIVNADTYTVVVTASNNNTLENLRITVRNQWTGVTTTILNTGTPTASNAATWTINEPGEYLISAVGRTEEGRTVHAGSVRVTALGKKIPIIDEAETE